VDLEDYKIWGIHIILGATSLAGEATGFLIIPLKSIGLKKDTKLSLV
jgi:hypothetical protein